jgi:hypothetical protein
MYRDEVDVFYGKTRSHLAKSFIAIDGLWVLFAGQD